MKISSIIKIILYKLRNFLLELTKSPTHPSHVHIMFTFTQIPSSQSQWRSERESIPEIWHFPETEAVNVP